MEIARQCTSGKFPVRGMESVVLLLFVVVLIIVVRSFVFFSWEELDDGNDGDGVEQSTSSLDDSSDIYIT